MFCQTLLIICTNAPDYQEPIERYTYVEYYTCCSQQHATPHTRKKLPVIDLNITTPIPAAPHQAARQLHEKEIH